MNDKSIALIRKVLSSTIQNIEENRDKMIEDEELLEDYHVILMSIVTSIVMTIYGGMVSEIVDNKEDFEKGVSALLSDLNKAIKRHTQNYNFNQGVH